MKRIILLVMVVFMLLDCHAQTEGGKKGQGTIPYAEEIVYLDTLRWLTGGVEYPEGVAADPDSLKKVWAGFAGLYSEGRYAEAYDFLKAGDRYGDVIVYLRNTTAVYAFVSGAWNECVSAHAGPDEDYFREMEGCYSLVLAMTRSVVDLGGEDPYIPPHYMDMVMDYARLIMTMGNFGRAETFDDEIYHASMAMYGHEPMARLLALSFRCPLLCRIGREDQARKELASFRSKTMKGCTGEDFEKLLKGVDAIEKSMKQE